MKTEIFLFFSLANNNNGWFVNQSIINKGFIYKNKTSSYYRDKKGLLCCTTCN